jgi:hypothetical protein
MPNGVNRVKSDGKATSGSDDFGNMEFGMNETLSSIAITFITIRYGMGYVADLENGRALLIDAMISPNWGQSHKAFRNRFID